MYSSLRLEALPRLIPPHSAILVAVSGGPDSVALAHVIWRYINENADQNLKMVISHINHKVRAEAEEEVVLVRSLAHKWDIPMVLHEFDAKHYAATSKKGFQEAAREWRYACWEKDLEQYGCDLLATGHHQGDQAETVLYRVIRGSGTAGLAGIYPRKNHIIRPLLTVSKEEIMIYCQRQGLPYALDKSNQEVCYDRNKIRLALLPILEKQYNKNIQESLARLAELSRWDEDYIESQVDSVWSCYCKCLDERQIAISLDAWNEPEAMLSRILRRAVSAITGEQRGLEYKFIKTIMEKGKEAGWRQDLPGLQVETTRDGFFFIRRQLSKEASPPKKTKQNNLKIQVGTHAELSINRWVELPALGYKVGIFTEKMSGLDIIWSTEFDQREMKDLQTPLICRTRLPGDRIFLKGIGHKTLKKVFQEKGISPDKRETLPLFASGDLVLWIPGISRSDLLFPSEDRSPRLYGLVIEN